MKKILKRWMLALVCLVAFQSPALADKDTPITVDKLPTAARQFIQKNFAGQKVALAKMESGIIDKSYDVIFTNGSKVEFDRNGNWTEISCKNSAVPAALVPTAIRAYLKQNHPGVNVTKIEKDRRKTEVDLSNGVEITFNGSYQVTDIDY